MKLPPLDLRSKIFLGSGLLLVPLAVALAFLVQYESGQIQAAQTERLGLTVSRPLVSALLELQALGPGVAPSEALKKLWAEGASGLATGGPALAFSEAGFRAENRTWMAPERLGALLGQPQPLETEGFASAAQALNSTVVYLADTSGLVLDPDLDSYYLMLALYQELPALAGDLTGLRVQTAQGASTNEAKLKLFSLADRLGTSTDDLVRQVRLSVGYSSLGPSGAPGFKAAMDDVIPPLAAAAHALVVQVQDAALGGATFDAGTLEGALSRLVPLVKTFHAAGSQALEALLAARISRFNAQLAIAVGSALAGLVLGTLALFLIGQGIRRRSAQLVTTLGTLAEGDLSHPVAPSLVASGDELGQLARSVQVLRDDLSAAMLSMGTVNDQLSALGSALAATAEESASAIEEMAATSGQVALIASNQLNQTRAATQTVQSIVSQIDEANGVTQAMAGQFFMFSQAMEANRRRVQETSAEAQITGGLAETLARTGAEGEDSMVQLRSDIETVSRQSHEIQDITKFILDIAERTNLLSMNAGIEAAHAGSTGRGFKVVADEIRKLAEVSSTQAQNIQSLVDAIATAAAQTLSRAETTGQSFAALGRDIGQVKTASLAIAGQIAQQEAEDAKLSGGLEEFSRFYATLSESLEHQVGQSDHVRRALDELEATSRQISGSMDEQKVGMDQAAEAVVRVRDTSSEVARILDQLGELMARFRT